MELEFFALLLAVKIDVWCGMQYMRTKKKKVESSGQQERNEKLCSLTAIGEKEKITYHRESTIKTLGQQNKKWSQ